MGACILYRCQTSVTNGQGTRVDGFKKRWNVLEVHVIKQPDEAYKDT